MAELMTPEQKGQPGYEGHLNDLVVTLPEVLRDNGYHTSTTGKWHLGRTEELSPAVRGFDESWVLVQGGASHFDDGRAIIGVDPKAIYLDNGKQVEAPKGFFSSDFYADKAIEYVDAAGDKPFFHVLSFTAPHWPLQAPDSYIKKYEGRYDQGYEAIRQQRLGKMKDMGLVGHTLAANVPFDQLPTWDELTDEQRKIEARKMEIYAAMVDNMDENIGRVIAHLKQPASSTTPWSCSCRITVQTATARKCCPATRSGLPLNTITASRTWAALTPTSGMAPSGAR